MSDELLQVLQSLRDPTPAMLDAGMSAIEDCKDSSWDSGGDGEGYNTYEYVTSDAHIVVWRAMLDAKIKELTGARSSAG